MVPDGYHDIMNRVEMEFENLPYQFSQRERERERRYVRLPGNIE
jgi:hypothetical protein